MNEPEFEQQLRAISPVAPRRAVEDRIAAELAAPPALPASGTVLHQERRGIFERLWPALGWASAGAAAGVAMTLALHSPTQVAPSQMANVPSEQAAAEPEVEHELLEVDEVGIVEESDSGFARVVRYESLERRRWLDGDGAVTVVEMPREDFVFVPVSFQ